MTNDPFLSFRGRHSFPNLNLEYNLIPNVQLASRNQKSDLAALLVFNTGLMKCLKQQCTPKLEQWAWNSMN
jgi:hypothetical protein